MSTGVGRAAVGLDAVFAATVFVVAAGAADLAVVFAAAAVDGLALAAVFLGAGLVA